MTIFRNILGVIVGEVVLEFSLYYVTIAIAWVVTLPIIGDIIRWGVEPFCIILPVSITISGVLSGATCYLICKRNKKGRKIGLIILALLMLWAYFSFMKKLYDLNGYNFAYIIGTLNALMVFGICLQMGLDKKEENIEVKQMEIFRYE